MLFSYHLSYFLLYSRLMNFLLSKQSQALTQSDVVCQRLKDENDNRYDDNICTKSGTNDDHQACIRRREPKRHSIKSLPGRKILSKQASITEVLEFFFLFNE